MIIKRLTMHNFGVYASTNTFEFIENKPVVLIGGLNGRGKTTFLEAVLLALYGANSFAYHESNYSSYAQYLRSFVNVADGTKQTYVELEFVDNDVERSRYIVKREWSALNKVRASENISVEKNGEYSEFLTYNWTMFVENILPSALSNFFFFDGEKIAELAVDNTNSQLKDSIRAMLGISVLDTLSDDVKRNIRRVQKKSESTTETKKIELLRNAKKEAEVKLKKIEIEIEEKKFVLSKLKTSLEDKKLAYVTAGGNVMEKRKTLFSKRALISTQKEQSQEKLIGYASGVLSLVLLKDSLFDIKWSATREKETEAKVTASNYIDMMFKKYKAENRDIKQVEAFVKYLNAEASKENQGKVFNISDMGLFQLKQLTDQLIDETIDNTKAELRRKAEFSKQSDEIENYLSVEVNEKNVLSLYKEIKILEQQIVEVEAELLVYEQKRSNASGECIRTTSDFNNNVSTLLKEMEADDENKRVVKYSEMAMTVLAEFSIRLQSEKTGVLGDTITSCYRKLANKRNHINKIWMDPITLDLTYFDKNGNDVDKSTLSAGEKQLMVISILWALAICSKKKLPVIIDTPLSRLDSNHRKSIIKKYFPYASEQTIILSTDSEIDKNSYELMKENVGDEFTLKYDDEQRRTSIIRGYFERCTI